MDMEDAHTVCLGLNTDASTSTADHDTPNACDAQHTKCPVTHRWAFFAVFDGHAGSKVRGSYQPTIQSASIIGRPALFHTRSTAFTQSERAVSVD